MPMGNKQYVSGRAREYRIMEALRKEGFEIVARSAGSHSEVDVWAIKAPVLGKYVMGLRGRAVVANGQIVLVQSKGGKSGKRERAKVEKSGLRRFEGKDVYDVEVRII
jgi:hypothetical protein